MTKAMGWSLGRQHDHFIEMNIVGKIAVFTKEGCFLV